MLVGFYQQLVFQTLRFIDLNDPINFRGHSFCPGLGNHYFQFQLEISRAFTRRGKIKNREAKRCRTCCRTFTQVGPSIRPSSPRKNASSSSDSATIGTTPACRYLLFYIILYTTPHDLYNCYIYIRGFFLIILFFSLILSCIQLE